MGAAVRGACPYLNGRLFLRRYKNEELHPGFENSPA